MQTESRAVKQCRQIIAGLHAEGVRKGDLVTLDRITLRITNIVGADKRTISKFLKLLSDLCFITPVEGGFQMLSEPAVIRTSDEHLVDANKISLGC